MTSVEKNELDSNSVEKGVVKTIDFNSLHSGASAHAHPKADDELHFDERENDGVKRLLTQRHVQMYVCTLSFILCRLPSSSGSHRIAVSQSVHKSDGEEFLIQIQSLDRWYHWYWSLPWIRVCASALWSSRHVDCESISSHMLSIDSTPLGVHNGRNRCIFLTLCCIRDDKCMLLLVVTSFLGHC